MERNQQEAGVESAMKDNDYQNISEAIEKCLHTYFGACNSADADGITACFTAKAVHYYPAPKSPVCGGRELGIFFQQRVQECGFLWTIDELFIDPVRARAAIEWSRFSTLDDTHVRGVDLLDFCLDEGQWRIKEVRPYLAVMWEQGKTQELEGFEYEGRGYPIGRPTS
jgi:hypothetical protein